MPGPLLHMASTVPFTLVHRRVNLLTLFIAGIFPDIMPVLISPVLICIFDLRGAKLNWFFTFFDQSVVGGLISAAVLISMVLPFVKFCPKLSIPFRWKQNHSVKAIVTAGFFGAILHVVLDKFV